MKQEWIRWEPIKNLAEKYTVNSIRMGKEGLIITLSSNDKDSKNVEMRFAYTIDAYRYTNESFCFKICADLSEKYGKDFYAKWSFFKVKQSDYSQWISEKSSGYADEFDFTHFCIVGSDAIVDILSRYEPEVKFVE